MSTASQRPRVIAGCFLVATLVASASSLAVVVFDGTLEFVPGQEWGDAEGTAVQSNYTQFGDQHLTPGGFPGSELDQLYVTTDGTWLYVGVTGNLEQNGNTIVLLLDTAPGGQTVLASEIAPRPDELPCAENGPPRAVQGLGQALLRDDNGTPEDTTDDTTSRDAGSTGTTLDTGFAPDHAIAVDTNGGLVYVTQYSLSDTQIGTWDDPTTGQPGCASPNEALPYYATRIYRGSGNVNSGNGTLTGGTNLHGSLYAFNNTGKLGVPGESDTPLPAVGSGLPGDPQSQTTGLEAKIHLADLGFTVPPALTTTLSIKVSVLLVSTDGFVSNQTLPGINAGTSIANLGWRPDFTAIGGDQFATLTQTTGQFAAPTGSIDGAAIVSNFGSGHLLASQDTVTSFGDRNCLTPTGGSELDELFLRTDGHYLYVGVTGNLETNANAQILLLDVQTGGQNTLATEIAPVVAELPCSGNGPPVAVQGLGQAMLRDDNGTPADTTDDTTSRDGASVGTILDTGFEPEYAVAIDTSGGTAHVTQYTLSASSLGNWDDPSTGQPDCAAPNESLAYYATRIYRGQIGVGATSAGPSSLTGGTNPNGSEFAFNNSGIKGVSGTAVATPAGNGNPGDPRSQTKGLEAKISLLDLGFAQNDLPLTTDLNVKAMVLLTSSDGYVSNQTLPGLGLGVVPDPAATNLGNRPTFTTIGGNQYVDVNLPIAAFSPTLDGKDIVNEFGTGNVVASQDSVTGFGDVQLVTVADCDQQLTSGSEIDQMFVQDDTVSLEIGITGNLEGNGNNLVIFLDTVADVGETTLDGNAGRISGMSGDLLPLQADYALVVNIYGGTAYVDLVNLITNTSVYIGAENINTGDGILDNGGPVPDWMLFFDDTNILGVSGVSTDDPQPGNAATAFKGVEMSIPLSAIGSPTDGTPICVFALVGGNNNCDYLSNQMLPGWGGGVGNLGVSPVDMSGLGCVSIYIGAAPPTCNPVRFDADGDDDVDSDDFAAFQRCLTLSGAPLQLPPECECFDWNWVERDGLIDLQDFAVFEHCSSGPGIPAAVDCDDVIPNP